LRSRAAAAKAAQESSSKSIKTPCSQHAKRIIVKIINLTDFE
jgi:hypothetical protein